MNDTRSYIDQKGRRWRVTRRGPGSFDVQGPRRLGERLHDIARSCAHQLGVTRTGTGAQLDYVNEHCRIWNAIWHLRIDT